MAGMASSASGLPIMKNDVRGREWSSKSTFNAYIHNYFVDEGYADLAGMMRNSANVTMDETKLSRQGNERREPNGIDDGMDSDFKDGGHDRSNNDAFLYSWWCIFWDMWSATRKKDGSKDAAAYLAHHQATRFRAQAHHNLFNQNALAQNQAGMRMMQAGNNDLRKGAMLNNGRSSNTTNPSFRGNVENMMGAGAAMQREGSNAESNPQDRAQSPSMTGENGPSPKRPRLDGVQFNPQTMGRMPAVNMNGLSQEQQQAHRSYSTGVAHLQKMAMQDVKNMDPNALMQVSPVMNANGGAMDPELLRNSANGNAVNGGALADYQMQLMLLEQQNKKRLMMAKQEQDVQSRSVDPLSMQGQMYGAPPMSPHNSQTGQSPMPNNVKRSTPQMTQNSPLPDGTVPGNRNSPAPGAFEGMQMGGQFPNMAGLPNGGMMRVPGSHPGILPGNINPGSLNPEQLAILRQHQSARLANGWIPGHMGGQMMPQGMMEQQRGNMPPPVGMPPGSTGKTQPSSPQQPAAPPTPSQSKANKPKKEAKETKKKPTKKGSTTSGDVPNPEGDKASSPPPPTPNTPTNPNAAMIKGIPGQNQNQNAGNNSQQAPGSQAQQQQGQPAQQPPQVPGDEGNNTVDNSLDEPFGNLGDGVLDLEGMYTGFGADNNDQNLIGDFDFDSFLRIDENGFDMNLSGDYLNDAGVGTENS